MRASRQRGESYEAPVTLARRRWPSFRGSKARKGLCERLKV